MPPTCSCCEPGRHFQPGRRAMLAGLGALAALPMTAPTRRAMAAEAVPKTSLTADQALAQAKVAEAEIAKGNWRGPMHGVPYAAKDIFDVEGMATTCHSKIRKDHRAASDAFVVKK